jgi:hypothetical protein
MPVPVLREQHSPLADDDDDDPSVPTNFVWRVATFDLAANTVAFSAGAPYGKYTDCTTPVGFHYNATASASSNTDIATAIIDTTLGPFPGVLDLTNVSNFVPKTCPDGHQIMYENYDPVDGPQTSFVFGDVLYALLDFTPRQDTATASDDRQRHMTWIDLSARCPDFINFAAFEEPRSCSAIWRDQRPAAAPAP